MGLRDASAWKKKFWLIKFSVEEYMIWFMLSILHTSDIYCFDHIFHKLFHWACLLNDYTTSHKSLFVNFVMSLVYFPWNILQRQKHSRKHFWKLKTCFESPIKRAASFLRSDQRMKTWRLLVTSFLFHQLNQGHRYDYRRQLEFIIEIYHRNASLFSSSSSSASSSLSSWSQRESCSFVLKCKDCRLQWTLRNKKRTPSPIYIDHHNHNHHPAIWHIPTMVGFCDGVNMLVSHHHHQQQQ